MCEKRRQCVGGEGVCGGERECVRGGGSVRRQCVRGKEG